MRVVGSARQVGLTQQQSCDQADQVEKIDICSISSSRRVLLGTNFDRKASMTRVILIVVMLLSGCVSYSEMQAKAPVLELDSAKSPDTYAGCVAPKFMEIWPGMVSVIPDGENTVVAVAAAGGTMTATVTIAPTAPGSHVTLREMSHINLGSVYERARVATKSCI